ncbi:uncharacterized protein TNCV_377911 [Trichonephila clavipes]|nr:uncharacterized protein TNCV_377911 [Trichonephila clavipes]
MDTHHRDVSAFSRIALHATFSIKLRFIPLISLLVTAATTAGYYDLSEFERGVIVGAREMRHSISEVSMKFGFSLTTISRVYREYQESGKDQIYDIAVAERDHARTGPTMTEENH